MITDPDCLRELWALTGRDMSEDVTLDPVLPFYRLNWPDGTNFDYSNDDVQMRAEIEKLHPATGRGMRSSCNIRPACSTRAMRSWGTSRSSTSGR